MRLLLTKEEIEKAYDEGVRNAESLSEVRAARTWRAIHRRHPWRGFFMDLIGSMAQAAAFATQPLSKFPRF